jgi:uncharacterized membrane protein YoaK (UPF0700 family)
VIVRAALQRDQAHTHLVLMLVLTFSTGVIDAVGYLGLDRVFTGNMTGNVVILGMGLLGADDLPVVGPVIALIGFVVGAIIAGRVLRSRPSGWSGRTTTLFTVVGALILAVALWLLAIGGDRGELTQYMVTGILGLVMGVQAATARHIAVKDVTTVVVTSTLAGLAADSRLGGNTGQPWKRRLFAVVLIGLGALTGAAALRVHISLGLLVAGGLILLTVLAGHLGRVRERSLND